MMNPTFTLASALCSILLLTACAAGPTAEDSAPDLETTGTAAERLDARIKGCGLVTDGEFAAISDPLPDNEHARPFFECIADCVYDSCETLTALYCDRTVPPSKLIECLDSCDTQISCGDGTTIKASQACNDIEDCADGRDEANCNQFTCDNGDVVPGYVVCDAENDCADGSDEAGCDYVVCGDGTRLRASARCNLVTECADGSDEAGCAQLTCM